MKKIILLGSTGSVGVQATDVVRHIKDLSIVGLSSYSNVERLKDQIKEFKPKIASVWKKEDALSLKSWCKSSKINTKIVFGLNGLIETAKYPSGDLVLSAVVGSIGIEPIIAAIRNKKNVALANKEALVVASNIILKEAKKNKVQIIPVDSEHSAIFQAIKNEKTSAIQKIILTASGGPFYKYKEDHSNIKVSDALDHPTWIMGKKITIDSATLMNKGLEAIEASCLFNLPLDRIEIVIHPQSIIHSMVQFVDGSVIAQLSRPDMRLPIQYALTYPDRYVSKIQELDFTEIKRLDFDKPDFKRFPCLNLAIKAGKIGQTMPAVMNASNEIAVEAFLRDKIVFSDIAVIISKVMDDHKVVRAQSIKSILSADNWARQAAKKYINEKPEVKSL
ncbi:1-deoxy-D-xylulose-5-phosphate reductoisomerase [Elusimicrobiota bacterium]